MSNFTMTAEDTFRTVHQGTIYTVYWTVNGVYSGRKFANKSAALEFAARGFPADFRQRGSRGRKYDKEYFDAISK